MRVLSILVSAVPPELFSHNIRKYYFHLAADLFCLYPNSNFYRYVYSYKLKAWTEVL